MSRVQHYWGLCQVCNFPALNENGPLSLVNNLWVCRRHVEYAREILYAPPPGDVPNILPGPDWNDRDTVEGSGSVPGVPPGQNFGTGELT